MRIDISNRIGTTSNFGGFRGLLDKFSGAAAGYSLRKLSKSATNAVRVRRSSDNTEQDIGFTGTELDTAALLAFVGTGATDDGFVTTWYDQAGSNDATQATAASQPQIVDGGALITENGKPSISFDGTDDFLAGLNLTVNSAFSVLTTPDIGSNVEPLLSGASRWFSFSDTNSHYYSSQFNYSSIYTGLTLGSAYYDGSNAYMFMNGDASADNPQSTTLLTNVDEIGRYSTGNFFNEKVLEIIIYPTDQSSNRTAIEGNINGHYNIYP